MSSRSVTFARVQIAFFALLAVLTVAVSLRIDLSKFQQPGLSSEDQAILRGISSPGDLESALKTLAAAL